jgi:hypothetical protein
VFQYESESEQTGGFNPKQQKKDCSNFEWENKGRMIGFLKP